MISETCWCLWRFVRSGQTTMVPVGTAFCTRTLPIPGHLCSEAQIKPSHGFGCAVISRVKPHKWLARSVQGRRSFSFAFLCCVHQRAGAALIFKKIITKPPGMGRQASKPPPKKNAFARRALFFCRRGLAAQCERDEAWFRPRLGRGAAKEEKKKKKAVGGCSLCRRPRRRE